MMKHIEYCLQDTYRKPIAFSLFLYVLNFASHFVLHFLQIFIYVMDSPNTCSKMQKINNSFCNYQQLMILDIGICIKLH